MRRNGCYDGRENLCLGSSAWVFSEAGNLWAKREMALPADAVESSHVTPGCVFRGQALERGMPTAGCHGWRPPRSESILRNHGRALWLTDNADVSIDIKVLTVGPS